MSIEKSILERVEDQFEFHYEKFKEIPVSILVSEETLDMAIDEIKKDCIWFIKTNEQMKEEGARYRGIIFKVDNSLEFGTIKTMNKM